MLSETVLVGTHRDPSSNVSDAVSIAVYDLHSYTQISTLKRSSTSRKGLAVTPTHLIAQQVDKAVVNIYSRAKNALESTVPFPEKFTAVAASPDGHYFAGGTESGRVLIWELASARFVSTPQSHLQEVSTLEWSSSGVFLFSGSEDSNVFVWSLPVLLDTRAGEETRRPWRVLDRHQEGITAIAAGRSSSGGCSDIVVTASRDRSCIVWDYHTVAPQRIFILDAVPMSLSLDVVDRGFYAGCADGTIQAVDFFKDTIGEEESSVAQPLYVDEHRHIPVSLTEARWSAAGQDAAITAIDVSYDGTCVITGNESGDVAIWDAASGQLFRNLAQMKAPINTLRILKPSGLPQKQGCPSTATIPKVRYEAILAATSEHTYDPQNYVISSAWSSWDRRNDHSPSISERDLETAMNEAHLMKGTNGSNLQGKQKIEALEAELRQAYDSYERLKGVHEKMWEGHAKWVLESGKGSV